MDLPLPPFFEGDQLGADTPRTDVLAWKYELTARVARIARTLDPIIDGLLNRTPPAFVDEQPLRDCYDAWLHVFCTQGPWLEEIDIVGLDDGVNELGQKKFRRVSENRAVVVFAELSRLWYVINYRRLYMQQQELLRSSVRNPLLRDFVPDVEFALQHTKHDLFTRNWPRLCAHMSAIDGRAKRGDVAKAEQEEDSKTLAERRNPIWTVPILAYNQSQVKAAVFLMTENLSEYPACSEVTRVIELLFTANSAWFCAGSTRNILTEDGFYMDIRDPKIRIINRDYM
jgi:hypothetical protein